MQNKVLQNWILLLLISAMPLSLISDDVKWDTDLKKALVKAKKENKKVLLDFSADWCRPCTKMDEITFKDAKLIIDMRKYICVRVDYDENPELVGQYRIQGIPALLKLNSGGRELSRSEGFADAKAVRSWLKKPTSKKVLKEVGIFEKLIKTDWNQDQFLHGSKEKRKELIEVAFEGYLIKSDSSTRELAQEQLKSFYKMDHKIFVSYYDDKRLGVRIFLGNLVQHLDKTIDYDPWETTANRKAAVDKIKKILLKK